MKNKMAVNITISDQLINDFKKFSSIVAKNAAIQTRDILTREYRLSIENFYNAYEPQQYNRGYGLYDSFSPYYKNSHGNIFYGGVYISAEKMNDDYHDPKEYVLDVALQGYHGTSAIVTYPAPLEHILKYRDYIQVFLLQNIINNAVNIAKKSNYNFLFKG